MKKKKRKKESGKTRIKINKNFGSVYHLKF